MKQYFNISEQAWEEEYKQGHWTYIATNAAERGRSSLIGTFIESYGGPNSIHRLEVLKNRNRGGGGGGGGAALGGGRAEPKTDILDIGCGEGILLDFLRKHRNTSYIGVDISSKAIEIATKKYAELITSSQQSQSQQRSSSNNEMALRLVKFMKSRAENFNPQETQDVSTSTIPAKYDVIVFNEMLYYGDHLSLLKKYKALLKPHGIVIISVFFKSNLNGIKDTIFADAKTLFRRSLDEFTLHGLTRKRANWKQTPVSWAIAVFAGGH